MPSPKVLLLSAALVFFQKAEWPWPSEQPLQVESGPGEGAKATNLHPIAVIPLQMIPSDPATALSAAVVVHFGKWCCLLLKAGIFFSVILFSVAFRGPSMWLLSLLITALGDYSVVLATERGRGRNGMVERERFLR